MNIIDSLGSLGPLALVLVAVIVFIENGLFFPFLPGDSLLFAAAILAVPLNTSWVLIAAIAAVAAIVGAELSFWIGRRYGRRLFRPGARLFKPEYLAEAHGFFERYGVGAIILARFVPIVRTYISPAAGVSDMPRARFSMWNAIGAVIWAGILGLAGALLGGVPWVANNIEWISIAIVLVTVAPVVIGALVKRSKAKRA
ncbi:MAG: DedA family protein [Microbacterium sp.]|uniref:DedA family protein n=1 Tax=Microbacterium ginsengisoli TaxID=400772 RepID=A0A0F0M0C2_9MICO|nr:MULTISPECIES: DedA family protein [Microbacterium]MAL05649.1 DedA family protein [Microbacterium sp.]KJL37096.1 Inner membrane protein YqjA [Microbacterium ginsengisoli]KQR95748.1 hypothetical protein ASG00_13640 [Microbacterium sp. Leaf351]KQR99135.1 hypothetical protein ASF93_12825 [Microbacterium sp. Leaf347]MBN9198462.1 DedA family protein [Microbacterium ginsengisoli]